MTKRQRAYSTTEVLELLEEQGSALLLEEPLSPLSEDEEDSFEYPEE